MFKGIIIEIILLKIFKIMRDFLISYYIFISFCNIYLDYLFYECNFVVFILV